MRDYWLIVDKLALAEFFMSIMEPTLVISAHNSYIFPRCVVEHHPLTIVNFHNSLLPRHAGRNAPSWAIFEMDQTAGITWHQVACVVDAGHVIAQRIIPIAIDDTGFTLTRKLAQLGITTLREILPQMLKNHLKTQPQVLDPAARMHLSTEVPNGGVLDLGWAIGKISAFLRCLDYGKLIVFPPPKFHLLGTLATVAGYRIIKSESLLTDIAACLRSRRVLLEDDDTLIELSLEYSYPEDMECK